MNMDNALDKTIFDTDVHTRLCNFISYQKDKLTSD